MSAKSEDQIIMKLLQKGERECDILDHLEKQGLVDEISIYRVQKKIREYKTAMAFTAGSRRRYTGRRIYGIFLIAASIAIFTVFWNYWLIFLFLSGLALLFFPDEVD